MDERDRRIINGLQCGFPVCERPFLAAARNLGLGEDELIERIGGLLAGGELSRFGPLLNAERLGGAVSLAALSVPGDRFEEVAALVNAHPEVAHNYERDHALNMWFVIAAERQDVISGVISAIEGETGLEVLAMPKLAEFFIGLRLTA